MMEVAVIVLGAGVLVIAALLVLAQRRTHALQTEVLMLTSERERLKAALEAQEERLGMQRTWLDEQMRFFEEKVSNATSRLLEERGRAFTEVNRRELDTLVGPFKAQLAEFRTRIDTIYAAEAGDRGRLVQQIEHLTQLNQAVSKAAEGLTQALTINSKATGTWGETILKRILEESGLREGHNYSLQHSIRSTEGDRQQPDAVIFLPENRQVIVDAKVSNKSWRDYCDAVDDAAREQALKEHLASLRAHIRGLAARDYSGSPDLKAVDFVLMFVPVEAALLTALSADEALYGEAYRSKIILVTPSTLMAVVKLVEGMWVFQTRRESAEQIAEAGRKLYEKLTTFSTSFLEIGGALEKAQGVFEKARDQLKTGRGSAIRLAEQMRELGVTPGAGKSLPPSLTAPEED
jgi:DNA recombination protein RmuC